MTQLTPFRSISNAIHILTNPKHRTHESSTCYVLRNFLSLCLSPFHTKFKKTYVKPLFFSLLFFAKIYGESKNRCCCIFCILIFIATKWSNPFALFLCNTPSMSCRYEICQRNGERIIM